MFSKIVLFAIVAVASAHWHEHHEQEHHVAKSWASVNQHTSGGHHSHHEEIHGHPEYEFKYGVEDKHTGDIKNQQEKRDGDDVHGSYSVVQPDGRTRVVTYTADKHGFNADVKYIGEAHEEHHGHHGW